MLACPMPSFAALYVLLAFLLGTPVVILVLVWQIFVTNRRSLAAAGLLGLKGTAEVSDSSNPAQDVANFGLLSFVTISFAVFFFDAVWFLGELLLTPIDYY